MAIQQQFHQVRNFTYGINRYAMADLENAILTLDYFIDKCLKENSSTVVSHAVSQLITTTIVFNFTPQFNALQCGGACDIQVQVPQISDHHLRAMARLTFSNQSEESQKDELCQVIINRRAVDNHERFQVDVDRNQDEILKIKEISRRKDPIHSHSFPVRPQDLNQSGFVPTACYVTYCQHAASHAIYCKHLPGAQNFTHILRLARMQIYVLSLVREENLLVEIWQQNVAERFIIDFRITSKDGIVCVASFDVNTHFKAEKLPFYEIPLQRSETCCNYDVPGFYRLRDRFNNAKLDTMLSYKVALDKMTMDIADIFGVRAAYSDGRFFPVRHEVKIAPGFYSILPDALVKCSIQLASMNRTSVIFDHILKVGSNKLLTISTKLVSVNHGRVANIPDSIMLLEALAPLLNKKSYSKVTCPNQIPIKAFKYSFTIRSNDIDINQHVNNAVYISACFDAASKAVSSGSSAYRTSFGRDFNPACLTELSASYYKQMFEHQLLDTFTWQDEDDDKLHFVMKHENVNIFYMTGNYSVKQISKL
ncbi:hypothetical protein TrispH2_005576 [Trichoplax sp. H2]|nr:hypothetical protein TrispH2_005576 [Trichoplax sp. H2]|eukprot:RDD42545.1 hypothetical protein TrispH2_005576 [Trichoplax sp. H2]